MCTDTHGNTHIHTQTQAQVDGHRHVHLHTPDPPLSLAGSVTGPETNTLPLARACDPETRHQRPCSFSFLLGSEGQVLVRTQRKVRQRDTGDPQHFFLLVLIGAPGCDYMEASAGRSPAPPSTEPSEHFLVHWHLETPWGLSTRRALPTRHGFQLHPVKPRAL